MNKTIISIGVILFVVGLIAANYIDPMFSNTFGTALAPYMPKPYASYSMPLMILGGALIVVGLIQRKKQ